MKRIESDPSLPNRSRAFATDAQRWQAVLDRDIAADGAFVYSVKTTSVYCRPSCAARRALRENVQFHSSCKAAETAGFRPCRRCHPEAASPADLHAAKIAAACRAIAAADEPATLATLAATAGMSPFHFHRIFTKTIGVTPAAYARAQRAQRARELLPRSKTVTEALYAAGFNSNGRFYAESSRMLGMTPVKFRRGGPDETIRFAIRKCPLGLVLVAASEKGVCQISLGDDPNRLARELRVRFPRANLIRGDKQFSRIVARVVDLIETPVLGINLPLDVRGTAFQQRVWQALRDIPAGATTTYAEVAERIGAPKAIRAVASACAANPVAVAVPCHRVLRADGQLAGYRWGLKRKRALLLREKTAEKKI